MNDYHPTDILTYASVPEMVAAHPTTVTHYENDGVGKLDHVDCLTSAPLGYIEGLASGNCGCTAGMSISAPANFAPIIR